MIELAPRRKQGFAIARPLIAAPGAIGYAAEAARLIELERFGALVTAAVSLRPRVGNPPPRLVELPGGCLLAHGDPSPGWARLRARHAETWARSKAPYIAHLVGHTSLGELVRRIEAEGCFGALSYDVGDEEALGWFAALRGVTEMPLLARLPGGMPEFARRVVAAGADALVAILPPHGIAPVQSGQAVEGNLFGPFVLPLALKAVRELAAADLGVPLAACGGIHTSADVAACLAEGACAAMVDSLVWSDPAAVNALLAETS